VVHGNKLKLKASPVLESLPSVVARDGGGYPRCFEVRGRHGHVEPQLVEDVGSTSTHVTTEGASNILEDWLKRVAIGVTLETRQQQQQQQLIIHY